MLPNLTRILVPVDFSEVSLTALAYAAPLAESLAATIYILYVMDRPPPQRRGDSRAAKRGEARAVLNGKKLLARAARSLKGRFHVKTRLCSGRPFDVITRFARAKQIDLIILARHGFAAAKDSLLREGTSELVTRYAPCPVLAVHEAERELI